MADVTEVGVIFPLAGVDVTCEFGRQPPDTAAEGQNVRAFEVVSNRSRGGSRCGLTQYIPQVVVGSTKVQHLAVLVDPQDPGLNAPTDGPVPDPSTNNLSIRNPGRGVRRGGSGRQPNRNIGGTLTSDKFVQMKVGQFGLGTPGMSDAPYNVVLDAQPMNGSLLLVFLFADAGYDFTNPTDDPASTFSIGSVTTGSGSRPYGQVGGNGFIATASYKTNPFNSTQFLGQIQVAAFQIQSLGSSDDQTVTVNLPVHLDDFQGLRVIVLEYQGVQITADNQSKGSGGPNVSVASPGTIPLANLPGELIIVGSQLFDDPNASSPVYTPAPGSWKQRGGFSIIEKSGFQGTSITPTITTDQAFSFCSIGIAYKST